MTFEERRDRWEAARLRMLERWRSIQTKIDARDAPAVLALANVMDEFCEEAVTERTRATGDRVDPAVPLLKFPSTAAIAGRCVFCRAFQQIGGCFGVLHTLNQAVLDHRWDEARRVAEIYYDRLLALDLGRPETPAVH
jgi:hypothetical protein